MCHGYEEDGVRTLDRGGHASVCLPWTLHVTAAQSACFQAAWSDLHSIDAARIKAAQTHAWIFDFAQIHTRGTALNYSFAAVALARVGEQQRNPSLLRQATVAYTLALARTKNRLMDHTLALTDESLGCTMLLALYEVGVMLVSSTASSHFCITSADIPRQAMHGPSDDRISIMTTHLDAAHRLVMHRGPAASGSEVSLLMLKDMLRTGVSSIPAACNVRRRLN